MTALEKYILSLNPRDEKPNTMAASKVKVDAINTAAEKVKCH
jgi:hypothetical protein